MNNTEYLRALYAALDGLLTDLDANGSAETAAASLKYHLGQHGLAIRASTAADAAARSSEGVKPLTADEVAALRPGQAIEVIWSGGNGPHHYIVREKAGTLYAGNPRNDNPLTGPGTFIGQERYHTRVWKLVRLAPSSEAVEARPDPLIFEAMARAAMRVVERRTPLSPGQPLVDAVADAIEAEYTRLATASSREGDAE